MAAQIIDGRRFAAQLREQVNREMQHLIEQGGRCELATIRVGGEFSARAYERRLAAIAAELGMSCQHIRLPETVSQRQMLEIIAELNHSPRVTGALLLRPLPGHLDEAELCTALAPEKDIEAVHPSNAGLLALGTPRYVPSTAASVFYVLDSWLDEIGEDRATFYHQASITIVGRSNNVGKPAVSLAYARQAAVTSIDEWASRSGQLPLHTRRADVVIVAAGVAGLIKREHVTDRSIVIDVGINPVTGPDGAVRMVGDVAFEEVSEHVRAMTPVPGGVGPVTDVWLMRNTVTSGLLQSDLAGRPARMPALPASVR